MLVIVAFAVGISIVNGVFCLLCKNIVVVWTNWCAVH